MSNTKVNKEHYVYYQMLAGAGAGAITKTSIAPLERIKILFQIQGMKKDGIGEFRVLLERAGGVGYPGYGSKLQSHTAAGQTAASTTAAGSAGQTIVFARGNAGLCVPEDIKRCQTN